MVLLHCQNHLSSWECPARPRLQVSVSDSIQMAINFIVSETYLTRANHRHQENYLVSFKFTEGVLNTNVSLLLTTDLQLNVAVILHRTSRTLLTNTGLARG
eukprot:scaffold205332_cov40-Cyclotella_meneghiniana.AAC.1